MISIRHEEVYVFPPPENPRIGVIVLAPKKLKLPAVQEILMDVASNNTVQTGLLSELSGLELTESPQFTVKLVKLPPQIPVELLEPGLTELLTWLPVELMKLFLTNYV